MGRATELYNYLNEHPRDDKEDKPSRPQLKPNPDKIVEVEEESRVVEALGAINRKEVRNVLLRDQRSGMEGVLLTVDRYVGLIATELESSQDLRVREDGQVEPAGLKRSEVETIDLTAGWPSKKAG